MPRPEYSKPTPDNPKAKAKAKIKKIGFKAKAKDYHPC